MNGQLLIYRRSVLCCKISFLVEVVILFRRTMCRPGLTILREPIWLPLGTVDWCLIRWFYLKCSGGRGSRISYLGQNVIVLFGCWLGISVWPRIIFGREDFMVLLFVLCVEIMRKTPPICSFGALFPCNFGIFGGEFGQPLVFMPPPWLSFGRGWGTPLLWPLFYKRSSLWVLSSYYGRSGWSAIEGFFVVSSGYCNKFGRGYWAWFRR